MTFGNLQHDEAFVQRLRQLGLNIKRPQAVEHVFYFPKPDRAEQAASELRSLGYSVGASTEPCDGGWSLVVRGQLVPEGTAISKVRTRMEQLAAKFNGEYDGWGLQSGVQLQ